jgi:hypothetical protein
MIDMTPDEQQEMVRWTEKYEDNIRMACGRLGCVEPCTPMLVDTSSPSPEDAAGAEKT